jgi:hypothetical protein
MAGFILDSHTTSIMAWCDITEYPSVRSGTATSNASAANSATASLSRRKTPNFEFNASCLSTSEHVM